MYKSAGGRAANAADPTSRRTPKTARRLGQFLKTHRKSRKLLLPFFMLGHAAGHLRLLRLMRASGVRTASAAPSAASCRYMRVGYLGGVFCLADCLSIATEHHRHLASVFSAELLDKLRAQGHALWQTSRGGHLLDIILLLPYYYNFDADLCLTMRLDGKDIYILSFSLCHGELVDGSGDRVMLVASIQGQCGAVAAIRQATAACQDIAPPQLLLAAAEALAQQIGVAKIAGLGAAAAAPAHDAAARPGPDYDAFWRGLTGVESNGRCYVMALPLEDKPIASVAAKHRGRARKRRAAKNQLRADIAQQAGARLAPYRRDPQLRPAAPHAHA